MMLIKVLIFLLVFSIFFSDFVSGSILDEAHESINALKEERGVYVDLYITNDEYASVEEFKNKGKWLYTSDRLNEKGKPVYNTIIYAAEVNGGSYIGYFHSYSCDIFTRLMQKTASGEVSNKEAWELVPEVVDNIEYALDIAGEECILHVCELIRSGTDSREHLQIFKDSPDGINPCEDPVIDENGKISKSAHSCKVGDKQIKCLYQEAFDIEENEKTLVNDKTVYLVPSSDWRTSLSLFPLAVYHVKPPFSDYFSVSWNKEIEYRKNNIVYNPWIVYHDEGDDVDAESLVRFLKTVNGIKEIKPEGYIIATREQLPANIKLALMDNVVGAGLDNEKISLVKDSDFDILWNNIREGYDSIVISDYDDYPLGLQAAHLASFFNAPLLFVNRYNYMKLLEKYDFEGRRIYILGSLPEEVFSYINERAEIAEELKYSDREDFLSELKNFFQTLFGSKETLIIKFENEKEVKAYIDVVLQTDKVIVANPNDIEPEYCEEFSFGSSFGNITKPYCGDSINAPLLASAKNELMVFVDTEPSSKSATYMVISSLRYGVTNVVISDDDMKQKDEWENKIQETTKRIQDELSEINQKTNYVTYIASPIAIPLSSMKSVYDFSGGLSMEVRKPLDYIFLEKAQLRTATGRIFGITSTDSSVYINSVLSFEKGGKAYFPADGKLNVLNTVSLVVADFSERQKYVVSFADQIASEGYSVNCYNSNTSNCNPGVKIQSVNPDILKNGLFFYTDHGREDMLSALKLKSYDIPELYFSTGVADACATGDYYFSEKDNLFSAHFIRQGGSGYIGAVSVTAYCAFGRDAIQNFMYGYDLGNTLLLSINAIKSSYSNIPWEDFANYYLLGDPTLKPALKKEIRIDFNLSELPEAGGKYSEDEEPCPLGTKEVETGKCIPEYGINSYYIKQAVMQGSPDLYCYLIDSQKSRDFCFDIYATKTLDSSVCIMLKDPDLADMCRKKVEFLSGSNERRPLA